MNYTQELQKLQHTYINNKILNGFSDIYIDEFFMYHLLSQHFVEEIIPCIEIYLIYKKFIENSHLEFLEIFNKINTNLNEIKKINDFDKEYLKLKTTIKKIFNHELLSAPIKLLNLSIIFNDRTYIISILNTDKCKKIIDELINNYSYGNKISLIYNNKYLDNNYHIDFYNIKNNDVINTLLIQTS